MNFMKRQVRWYDRDRHSGSSACCCHRICRKKNNKGQKTGIRMPGLRVLGRRLSGLQKIGKKGPAESIIALLRPFFLILLDETVNCRKHIFS